MTTEQKLLREAYLELVRNESRNLGARLQSMLTFQGLVFTAVGISAGQKFFVLAIVLALVAGLSCVPWHKSVLLSYKGWATIIKEYNNSLGKGLPPLEACSSVKPGEFWNFPEVFLPLAIAMTWIVVFVVLFYYWQCVPLPEKPWTGC